MSNNYISIKMIILISQCNFERNNNLDKILFSKMVDLETQYIVELALTSTYLLVMLYYLVINFMNLIRGRLYSSWLEIILGSIFIIIFILKRNFNDSEEKKSIDRKFFFFALLIIIQLQIFNFIKSLILIYARDKIFKKPTQNTFLEINSNLLHWIVIFIIYLWSSFFVFLKEDKSINWDEEHYYIQYLKLGLFAIGLILPFINIFTINRLIESLDKKYNLYYNEDPQNTKGFYLDKNFFIKQKEKILNKLNQVTEKNLQYINHKFENKIIYKKDNQTEGNYRNQNENINHEDREAQRAGNINNINQNDVCNLRIPLISNKNITDIQYNKTCSNNIYISEERKSENLNIENNMVANNLVIHEIIYDSNKNKCNINPKNDIILENANINQEINSVNSNIQTGYKHLQNKNELDLDNNINDKNNNLSKMKNINLSFNNKNGHYITEKKKFDIYNDNLNFIKKITFEDLKYMPRDEENNIYDGPNLKKMLKEKYFLISIFCEFQLNKIYADFLIYLLTAFINIVVLIFGNEHDEIYKNYYISVFCFLSFFLYLFLSCNLYAKFDEIIFNNKNDKFIKIFFFTYYEMFSINFFRNVKRIAEGYERYSSLTNSRESPSRSSNFCFDQINKVKKDEILEPNNSNMFATYISKYTMSDEKFINNHLVLNLFFKILKAFYQRNEKYFIKQEKVINLLHLNTVSQERKSCITNNQNQNGKVSKNINNTNNANHVNGSKDIVSILNYISESSIETFELIKKKLSLSFKRFLNKVEDFEIRNLIDKKLRNDVLANTTADENFIINNNISDIDFKIDFLFSEYTLELSAFFDIKIKDILEAFDQIKNKVICKIAAEKKKNDGGYNCFSTHDNFLYFEIYDACNDYYSNLKLFMENYYSYMRENIINWNHTYIPLIIGIFKISFMNFDKVIILYRHPCAFSIFKDFKYWINIGLNDITENVTISTTQNQIVDIKLIEVMDNISFHPNDYEEFYDILIRDLDFLKKTNFNPSYCFNIFVLNDFKKFLNDSASELGDIAILENKNINLNQNINNKIINNVNDPFGAANKQSFIKNSRVSVKSQGKNNSDKNLNNNLIAKTSINANTNLNFNSHKNYSSKSICNTLNKNKFTLNEQITTKANSKSNINNFVNIANDDENHHLNKNTNINLEDDKSSNTKNVLYEILSRLDKSELVRDESKRSTNFLYRKQYGSETVCSLDRINDYFNSYNRYTIKFYFSNILQSDKMSNAFNPSDEFNNIPGKNCIFNYGIFLQDLIKTKLFILFIFLKKIL